MNPFFNLKTSNGDISINILFISHIAESNVVMNNGNIHYLDEAAEKADTTLLKTFVNDYYTV